MHRTLVFIYVFILIVLVALLSLPKKTSDAARGKSISLSSPLWERTLAIRNTLEGGENGSPFTQVASTEEIDALQLDNLFLRQKIKTLERICVTAAALQHQKMKVKSLALDESEEKMATAKRLQDRLSLTSQAIPARVIFRSIENWNQTLWINVGETTNEATGQTLIAINSPVIHGTAIVGIIDFVGKEQSRVRLITDSSIHPSVRVVRGGEERMRCMDLACALLEQLKQGCDVASSCEEELHLIETLKQYQKIETVLQKNWYLAKGELLGAPHATKRGSAIVLKGAGFNCDFADRDGVARDLRSGKPIENSSGKTMSLIKEGDLLVTTGMDGLFPADFPVAKVTKVLPLQEGDYYYDIEASPIDLELSYLSLVFVLPPIQDATSAPLNAL